MTTIDYILVGLVSILATALVEAGRRYVRGVGEEAALVRSDLSTHMIQDREDMAAIRVSIDGMKTEVHEGFVRLSSALIEALAKR